MTAEQRRRLTWLTISFAALGYFEYLFFYWLQHYLLNSLKMPTEAARSAAAIPMVGMALGMPAGGWLSDRLTIAGLHRGWVPAVGLVLGAAFVLAGASCTQPIPAVVCFTFAMAAAGACEAPYWTTSTKIGGDRGGTAAAILNTGSNAGGMLAPVVTPLLSSVLGWQGAISAVAFVCLPAAPLWIWIGSDGPSSEPISAFTSPELATVLKVDERLTS